MNGVLFFSIGLSMAPRGPLVDGVRNSILALIGCSKLWFRLFPFVALLRGAVDCASGHVFNLNVLLNPEEDVFYLGDHVPHLVLVKGVGDL